MRNLLSIEHHLRRFFFNYGFFAYKFRYVLIIVPVMITIFMIPAIPLLLAKNNLGDIGKVFSAPNARHVIESRAFKERWSFDDSHYVPNAYWNNYNFVDVLIYTKDPEGNLMNYLYELAKINVIIEDYIIVEMYEPVFDKDINTTYKSFCANYEGGCFDNFLTLFHMKDHYQDGLALEKSLRGSARNESDNGTTAAAAFVDAFLGAEGSIARKYALNFDTRWPTATKQGGRVPISDVIAGTNAITSLHFVDVYKPRFSQANLDVLTQKLLFSAFINVTDDQVVRSFLILTRLIGGGSGVPLQSTIATLNELQDEWEYGMGKFDHVSAVRFHYAVKQRDSESTRAGREWLEQTIRFLYGSDEIHEDLEADAFFPARHALSMLKYTNTVKYTIAAAFIFLCFFTALCSLIFYRRNSDPHFAIDWVRSKTAIALLAVLSSAMSILTAIGFLLYTGFPFTSVVLIMPYLIVAIGVDDMFVICGCWARTDAAETTVVRLAKALSYSAVAVTVTSLTDALSFAVGSSAEIPFLWIFCGYTGLGITVNYVYQLTFLVGCLAVWGDVEAEARHNITHAQLAPDDPADTSTRRILNCGRVTQPRSQSARAVRFEIAAAKREGNRILSQRNADDKSEQLADGIISSFFYGKYSDFLLLPQTAVLVVVLLVAYLSGAIYGLTMIVEGMDAGTLAVPTSIDPDGANFFRQSEATFWAEGDPIDLLLTQVPDISIRNNRIDINTTIQAFLYQEHSMGNESVWFWLWRFEKYWEELRSEEGDSWAPEEVTWLFYRRLRDTWLVIDPEAKWWEMQIHFRSNDWTEECDFSLSTYEKICPYYLIDSVRVRIGGRRLRTSKEVKEAMYQMRETADLFPQYAMFVQSRVFFFFYGFSSTLELTLRSLAIVVGVLVIVALLFIPSLVGVGLVTASIFSIGVGELGYLALWDIHVDNVSCIAIVMVAGFAVNLVGHFTHAFVTGPGEPEQKMRTALANFGSPILQGGVSSLLACLIMSIQPYYISRVFFRSVFICIAAGLFHALVLLPVALVRITSTHRRPQAAALPNGKAQVDTVPQSHSVIQS